MTPRYPRPMVALGLLFTTGVSASAQDAAMEQARPFLIELRARDAGLSKAEPRRAVMASTGILAIGPARPDRSEVPVYETVEFAPESSGTWINPFDPDDARLDALVTRPDGSTSVVPGFYMVGYERSRSPDGAEVLSETGQRGWRLRFTPLDQGEHTVRLRFSDGSGEVLGDAVRITATEPTRPGFVRRSQHNFRTLEHDDGSLFFSTGLNHGWPDAGATYDYDQTLERTAANRGNTVRIWLATTFHRLSLETSERIEDHGLLGGLGWMNQDAAWRFDHVVDRAEELGIKVLPVAFSFSGWRSANGPSNWKESPYNTALGGPMDRARDVFTDPVARTLAKRRLRYIVARYGHSPAVMAWELLNEVTCVDDYDDEMSAEWHKEIAAYLKELDAYDRLVTTSTWWAEGTPHLDGLDDIDIVMTHEYNAPDHAVPHYGAARWKPEAYRKPHLTGEFGNQEFDGGDSGIYEPETISVHNVLWASLMGGSAGGGFYWYWEIGNKAGWHALFRPLADFVDELPLHRTNFEPFAPRVGAFVDESAATGPAETLARLPSGAASWNPGEINQPQAITLDAAGFADRPWLIPAVLHAERKTDLYNPLTLRFRLVRPGSLTARVGTVSGWGGASLRFEVNGSVAAEHEFPDSSDEQRGEDPTCQGAYSIDLPAGEHTVRISCPTGDWVRVGFEIDGLLDPSVPSLWATGLQRPDAAPGEVAAIVWLRHRDYAWGPERAGARRSPVEPASLEIPGLPDAEYHIEWTDTRTGEPITTVKARSAGGLLSTDTPTIHESAAAKVRRR